MSRAPLLVLLACLFLITLIPVANVSAAALVEAKYDGRFRAVVDAKRFRPVIEYEGKRKTLGQLLYKIHSYGGEYTDASYELKDEVLDLTGFNDVSTGNSYNTGLEFSCLINVDAPLKDCFMAIEFITQRGEKNIIIRELPNLKANRWNRIRWEVQTHISFGSAKYRYYFFSEGKQIPNRKNKNPFFSEDLTDHNTPKFEPPKIVKYHPLSFPEALSKKFKEGRVKLELTVLETGEVTDIKVLESTHHGFEKPAIEAIQKCTWKPATIGGEPSTQTIRQDLTFKSPD